MKRVMSILAVMVLSLMMVGTAFAAPIGSGFATTENGGNNTSNNSGFNYSAPDDPADIFGVDKVDVDDVADRLNNKGNDVINIMQVVGRYVCYGAFIIGVLIMIFGCIGNKRMIVQGLIVLIIAGVAYAGIVCGREIVGFIASWAAS